VKKEKKSWFKELLYAQTLLEREKREKKKHVTHTEKGKEWNTILSKGAIDTKMMKRQYAV